MTEDENREELVVRDHRVSGEAPHPPAAPPLVIEHPLVGEDVVDDQRLAVPRDPADGALVVAGDLAGKVVRDLRNGMTGQNEGPRPVIGEPERDEAHAGELRRAFRDRAEEGGDIQRARDALVHGGERADARALHVLRLIERRVTDRHAGVRGEQVERFLLLSIRHALGHDVIEHAHEHLADHDRHAVVRRARPLPPPFGREGACVRERVGDEHRTLLLRHQPRQTCVDRTIERKRGHLRRRRHLHRAALGIDRVDGHERAGPHRGCCVDDTADDVRRIERGRDRARHRHEGRQPCAARHRVGIRARVLHRDRRLRGERRDERAVLVAGERFAARAYGQHAEQIVARQHGNGEKTADPRLPRPFGGERTGLACDVGDVDRPLLVGRAARDAFAEANGLQDRRLTGRRCGRPQPQDPRDGIRRPHLDDVGTHEPHGGGGDGA